MDREVPVEDQATQEDASAALLAVTMLMAATPLLIEWNLSSDQLAKIMADGVVGLMRIGGEQLKAPLLEELRKALDRPDQNWSRFHGKERA